MAAYLWGPTACAAFTAAALSICAAVCMHPQSLHQWSGYIAQLRETLLFCLAVLAFVGAHALGKVGFGAGAGLRLAGFALTGRVACQCYSTIAEVEGDAISVYESVPSIAPGIWLWRNVGLVFFVYGIVLTAISCALDARQRRRHPAYVPLLED